MWDIFELEINCVWGIVFDLEFRIILYVLEGFYEL